MYKVDRLSRSLIDFSKIIDVLDKHQVSFVSVTQQFNTSNSMGRLTLNILLSFAQFEREIIAERTRDKMCAARRKGKWIGGIPMLGYDVDQKSKKLVINREEAACVSEIFRLYIQHRSLTRLAQELNSRGWTTKSWVTKNGRERIGKPFAKTNLHSMLTNMIYLGKVEHQGEVYEGEHEAIIEESVWARVQQIMENNFRSNGQIQRNRHGALLRGLVVCGSCSRSMHHTYTKRSNRLYRYYVCETAQKQGYKTCPTKSIPAQAIETFVVDRIKRIGTNPEILEDTIKKLQADLDTYKKAIVSDYADIARLSDLTRARLSQIMNLILLAPKIQEEILSFTKTSFIDIREHHLREILKSHAWQEQYRVWKRLKSQAAACIATK